MELPSIQKPDITPAHADRALSVLVLAAYLGVAGYVVYLSRDQINPDGVSYIQIARHYAAGRLDLAVTSFWGPLLSWLLVPALWLHAEPVLVAKILGIGLGAFFAAGAARIARELNPHGRPLYVFFVSLAMALSMLPEPVTPDLLLAAILTWYFAFSIRLLRDGSAGTALAAGALGGLAFCAKAYALPFVATHLILTFVIKIVLRRKRLATGGIILPLSAALLALAVVSVPWIIVISRHDGRSTIGSAAQLARLAFSPAATADHAAAPIYALQTPPAGRMAAWEDPSESRPPVADKPLLSASGIAGLAKSAALNLQHTLESLRKIDLLGLVLLSFIISMAAVFPLRESLSDTGAAMRLWLCLSALLYIFGYILITVYDRFLWAIFGLLVVLAKSCMDRLVLLGSPIRPPGGDAPAADGIQPSIPGKGLWRLTALLLLLSVCYSAGLSIKDWRGQRGAVAKGLREVAAACKPAGAVVSNRWEEGLSVSFWAGRNFLGRYESRTPQSLIEELRPYGPASVIVINDEELADQLCQNAAFISTELVRIPSDIEDSRPTTIDCFEFVPPPSSP